MFIAESKTKKVLRSDNYNFIYNKETGFFARWGKTQKDDPQMCPYGNEILDLEISSGNIGTKEQTCKGRCKFCYKSNNEGSEPIHNMTFEEFKIIFNKQPRTLTQIAFGIMNISTNADFFPMMEYAKEHGITPNYTCHGLDVTPEIAKKTAKLCGAVAVSLVNKEKTYDAIKMFSIDNKMDQVNCHYMLSMESYEEAFKVIDDISTDPRLKNFNAIVFLQYKHKNPNSTYHSVLDLAKYKDLTNYCEERGVRYGFDSCSGPIFIESLLDTPDREFIEMFVEPCESLCMSYYINSKGIGYPCSFVEGIEEGVDVLNCDNFVKDIWYNKTSKKWREKLLKNNRKCPVYDLDCV